MSSRDESTSIGSGTPACIVEVRQRLEAEGHYVTIDGRITEQTAASIIPCPASRLRRWRQEGKGPRFYQPAKTPWYYLGDVLAWIQQGEGLR
ncbi:MAG: hypothetical protein KH046_06320 [Stenotrophomonas maltophilia]|uniref:DNA-binding protein n=2 Tax=Stenotrophomonas TaxID=40323 RepID=A0A2J0UGU0_STEMA|nr:hypothetical protein [Stenotrophomonas maltophilia]MBS4800435.1 hypothetical protein [Stenotrophomonas maltophilia]PJL34070.1 hypothetical protein B9Y64_02960 [Stenotrophomonas maltophilia]